MITEKKIAVLNTVIASLDYLKGVLNDNFSDGEEPLDCVNTIGDVAESLQTLVDRAKDGRISDESDKWAECEDCCCRKCKHRSKCPASDCYDGIDKGINVCKECTQITLYFLSCEDDCDQFERCKEAQ